VTQVKVDDLINKPAIAAR